MSDSLQDCSPPGFSVHGDSPRENTAVGCHVLLQGIFPTERSNPGLPHCRWILHQLSHETSLVAEKMHMVGNLHMSCVCAKCLQSCLTLFNPVDCSTPGFRVLHHLPELAQTHVQCISDAIQLSHPLSFPSSQHQGLFKWVSPSHQVTKLLEFQIQHQSFQWIFRTYFL